MASGRDIEIDEEAVRRTAYFMWEQAGRPDGGAQEYWFRALEKHRNQKTYDRWLGEGVRESGKHHNEPG